MPRFIHVSTFDDDAVVQSLTADGVYDSVEEVLDFLTDKAHQAGADGVDQPEIPEDLMDKLKEFIAPTCLTAVLSTITSVLNRAYNQGKSEDEKDEEDDVPA